MIYSLNDKEALWPEGEYISLTVENSHDSKAVVQLGNFAVKHGWNALVQNHDEKQGEPFFNRPKKLFLIPKAAKPTNNQP